MAGVVRTTYPAAWLVDIDFTPAEVALKRAIDGDGAFSRRAMGEPDFIVEGFMDVSAESLTAIDLTARGVTFPAGTQRTIEV